MTPGYVPIDEVAGQGKAYRLWRKPQPIAGNPNIILVHGAVVPLLIPTNEFHDPKTMNNKRFGFYDLDSLLYNEFHYNVFTFEYADEPVGELGYVNYGCLDTYGDRLKEAIGVVKSRNESGTVNIIAHSMGGLVARYAAKHIPGTVNTVITLDTGHLGFGLANLIDTMLIAAGIHLPPPFECCEDAEEGSAFIQHLNEKFDANNPKLVSLAALDPIPASFFGPGLPPAPIIVVGLHSSSMGQVDDYGRPTSINYNMPFPHLHYNHMSISQITDASHGAYQKIKEFMS